MGRFRQPARGRALACLAVALTFAISSPFSRAQSAKSDDATALAERIDGYLAAAQAKAGVKPTKPASDAEFLRRAALDVTGRIPRLNIDMHKWLDDRSPAKRREPIHRLPNNPYHLDQSPQYSPPLP